MTGWLCWVPSELLSLPPGASLYNSIVVDKKHSRNFSLDVHPYMLAISKPKEEPANHNPGPAPATLPLACAYIEGTHSMVHMPTSDSGTPRLAPLDSVTWATRPFLDLLLGDILIETQKTSVLFSSSVLLGLAG